MNHRFTSQISRKPLDKPRNKAMIIYNILKKRKEGRKLKKALMFLTLAFFLFGLVACVKDTTTTTTTTSGTTTSTAANTNPVFAGVGNVTIYVGDEFDPLEGVTASDAEDGDVTANITVAGTVDTENDGTYTLTYTVTDSDGGVATATRTVTVLDVTLVYPTGFYNFKFADTELRHTFMAAAEKYLMNNMYGGIPVFANGSFNLYSSRLQLPVSEYVAVMGYGTAFATMSADDSTVLMDDGELGNAGEYTYRGAITGNPTTFNQWLYDDSVTADVMGVYLDALYVYHFNADKTGYEVVPSMASGNPVPVDSEITETGKEVANTWRIPLRDDLVWAFHDDTDLSGLAAGYEVIDANDFYDTFKLALDEQWFRAISGGGDFLNTSTGILNAQEYVDGNATWEQVGIKMVDDLTLEFTFVNQQSEWNVRYWLSSFVMTPICIELYDALTVDGVSSYGTSNTTIGYHGPFVLDYYEADKILRYVKNDVYHDPNEYFYTGYTFSVIRDSAIRFQEFVAGKLEAVGLPTEYYNEYKNYPGLKQVPGATTFRIMINGLGTVENQQAQFPGSTYTPEPILANQNFKMAMFFAIDRQKLAEEVLKTSTTQMYLFSDAYLVDPELGVPYRSTSQGESVGEGLSPSTYGYNADAAHAYFLLAVEELLADGTYTAGTTSAPTVIELTLNIFSGSEAQVLFGDYIKTTFEANFQDYLNHVQVKITVVPKDFPSIYYDYMMTGDFDLSIGGISGSTLDAASFLDVFCSDNRGGFTLNWGIDTTVAEIPVLYSTFDGVKHLEMWSFDSIASALNGEVYIIDGEEAEVPAAKIDEIGPDYVTFTIELFNSPAFTDITYTIQVWDNDLGEYVDVEGLIGVVPASATVTQGGLTSYFYYYNGSATPLYQGDYQVVINYAYTEDTTKTGQSIAPWFNTESIIQGSTKDIKSTGATVALTLWEGYTGTVSSAVIYNRTAGHIVAVGATIDYSDLSAVVVSGLAPATAYYVILTFSDGNIDVFTITTTIVDAKVVTPSATGAVIALTLESDYTGTVASAAVTLTADGSAVAGAAVDFSDLSNIAVTGLAAGTAYTVTFTFSDGLTYAVAVTTTAE